ncbi:MAG: hypothetical protein OEZ02_10630, partial [Anaerolineae bacterium]|nr:hypothetical protein [Anaerolineae bacterium]
RNQAIDLVRDNGATDVAESNLVLLQVTIRKDVREIMPVVNLFETLLGTQRTLVDMALKYIVQCLKPFDLKTSHKQKLIGVMKSLRSRYSEDQDLKSKVDKIVKELKLDSWGMRKYWD